MLFRSSGLDVSFAIVVLRQETLDPFKRNVDLHQEKEHSAHVVHASSGSSSLTVEIVCGSRKARQDGRSAQQSAQATAGV